MTNDCGTPDRSSKVRTFSMYDVDGSELAGCSPSQELEADRELSGTWRGCPRMKRSGSVSSGGRPLPQSLAFSDAPTSPGFPLQLANSQEENDTLDPAFGDSCLSMQLSPDAGQTESAPSAISGHASTSTRITNTSRNTSPKNGIADLKKDCNLNNHYTSHRPSDAQSISSKCGLNLDDDMKNAPLKNPRPPCPSPALASSKDILNNKNQSGVTRAEASASMSAIQSPPRRSKERTVLGSISPQPRSSCSSPRPPATPSRIMMDKVLSPRELSDRLSAATNKLAALAGSPRRLDLHAQQRPPSGSPRSLNKDMNKMDIDGDNEKDSTQSNVPLNPEGQSTVAARAGQAAARVAALQMRWRPSRGCITHSEFGPGHAVTGALFPPQPTRASSIATDAARSAMGLESSFSLEQDSEAGGAGRRTSSFHSLLAGEQFVSDIGSMELDSPSESAAVESNFPGATSSASIVNRPSPCASPLPFCSSPKRRNNGDVSICASPPLSKRRSVGSGSCSSCRSPASYAKTPMRMEFGVRNIGHNTNPFTPNPEHSYLNTPTSMSGSPLGPSKPVYPRSDGGFYFDGGGRINAEKGKYRRIGSSRSQGSSGKRGRRRLANKSRPGPVAMSIPMLDIPKRASKNNSPDDVSSFPIEPDFFGKLKDVEEADALSVTSSSSNARGPPLPPNKGRACRSRLPKLPRSRSSSPLPLGRRSPSPLAEFSVESVPTSRNSNRGNGFLDTSGLTCASSVASNGCSEANRFHNDFDDIQLLGTGSFGEVYSGISRIDGIRYAIKKIESRGDADLENKEKELFALAALSDDGARHVVRYQQAWTEKGDESEPTTLFIQMELCEHTLLKQIVEGILQHDDQRFKLLREMCLALEALHALNMVHLDIKPENVFYKNNQYKLGDFGHANLKDAKNDEDGDSKYLAREMLAMNKSSVDFEKCDIFSLGATIYHVCLGRDLPANEQQWHDIRDGKLDLLPNIHPELRRYIVEMMHPDPKCRPTAEEMLKKEHLQSHEQKTIRAQQKRIEELEEQLRLAKLT